MDECFFCRKSHWADGGGAGTITCCDCEAEVCPKHSYELPWNHVLDTTYSSRDESALCAVLKDQPHDVLPMSCYEKWLDKVQCGHEDCVYRDLDDPQVEDDVNAFVDFLQCDKHGCDLYYCGIDHHYCAKCVGICDGCEGECDKDELYLLPGSYYTSEPHYCPDCYCSRVCSYCGEGLDDEEDNYQYGGMCKYCAVKEGPWVECDNCHAVVDPEEDKVPSIMGEEGGYFYKVEDGVYYRKVLNGLEDEYDKVYVCAECTFSDAEVAEQQPWPPLGDDDAEEGEPPPPDDPKQMYFDYTFTDQ